MWCFEIASVLSVYTDYIKFSFNNSANTSNYQRDITWPSMVLSTTQTKELLVAHLSSKNDVFYPQGIVIQHERTLIWFHEEFASYSCYHQPFQKGFCLIHACVKRTVQLRKTASSTHFYVLVRHCLYKNAIMRNANDMLEQSWAALAGNNEFP
jgi:hypothetical protein